MKCWKVLLDELCITKLTVESISKSRFDPDSDTYRAIPLYHSFGIEQASVPSDNLVPGFHQVDDGD